MGKVENKKSAANIVEFPDTNISLTHVKGDKYELHREFGNPAEQDLSKVYLGDGVAVEARGEKVVSKNAKMSAKQRPDMKRGKKDKGNPDKFDDEEDNVSWLQPNQHKDDREDNSESIEKPSQAQGIPL